MQRFGILCAILLSLSVLRAADDNKEALFNTFYLDGDKITYVLVLKPDRSFKLYGPNDRQITGKFKASTEHLSLTAGDVKRFFHFDNRGDDLKIGQRDTDVPTKGNLLGEMPPTKGAVLRTVYVAERNWKKKGLPVFTPPDSDAKVAEEKPKKATPDALPIVAKPESKPEAKPESATAEKKPDTTSEKKTEPAATAEKKPEPAAAAKPLDKATLPGTYVHRANLFVSETLTLKEDGSFSYSDSNNSTVSGTYALKDSVLTLTAGEVTRELTGSLDGNALLLTRTDKDNPKFKNDLASMSPTVLKEAKYERK